MHYQTGLALVEQVPSCDLKSFLKFLLRFFDLTASYRVGGF
jgi:hypothetical protein